MQHTQPQKKKVKQKITEEETYWQTLSDNDVQELLSWHAPGRPFRQRTREYFINGLLIMIAVEIILFLFSQYLLMVVVAALLFLSFALSSVPPRSFFYRISTEGVLIENNFFIWDELYDFYFMQEHEIDVLHIRTKAFFPGELIITLGMLSKQEIKAALLPFLPFREHVEPGFVQKAGSWLERNFPLEKSMR
jgi:hypothetical protein